MTDLGQLLGALQYGDSFFPSGAVAFSWGLEGLAAQGRATGAADVEAFVMGQLQARWATFDRAVVVAAHRAGGSIEAVAAIDRQVEIQTVIAELRSGSRRMGEAMLSVFERLGTEGASSYRALVKSGGAPGHLAAMQGFLWGQAGLGEAAAQAASAHGFAVGLLGAGVRLGCLSHLDAQRILTVVGAEAARIAASPAPPPEEMSAFAMEAELAVIHHARQDLKLFAN